MIAATPTPDRIIKPHPGPQSRFLRSNADIAIYGGAAGGGKSYSLLLEPLRYKHIQGFSAVVFRRTSPEITKAGSLWDCAMDLYPHVGGRPSITDLEFRFSNAKIAFGHLEHETDLTKWHGSQICCLEFDELTTFTERQFFYLLSRNRSTCGVRPYVRASCNPDARSWVAQFIAWWIDQDTGYPILERSGIKRWFCRDGDRILWADTEDELIRDVPGAAPKSVTFVPAKLEDNPTLTTKDPAYRANLLALPRVERERLLGGNWKIADKAIIDPFWMVRYSMNGELMTAVIGGKSHVVSPQECRRFATVDTAGTSREMAEEKKGTAPSWSVCAVWDYAHSINALLLRYVWRDRVGWADLKTRVPDVLATWRCSKAYIENAHHGPALRDEIRGISAELIGPTIPGMTESHRGAKLERAIASGLLSRLEDGRLLIPREESPWVRTYINEMVGWGGLPNEPADQVDVSSYAAHVVKRQVANWGGPINSGGMKRG